MRRTPLVTAALALSLLASPAAAQLYEGSLDDHEYLRFVGPHEDRVVATWGGVYVGPYVGQFWSPTSPQFSLFCVDYTHTATSQWVDVTEIAYGADFGSTRYQDFGTYRQLAYLSSLFDSWQEHDLGTNSQRTAWSAIHSAIWYVSNGEYLGSGQTAQIRNALLWGDDHERAAAGYGTDGWYVLSPNERYGSDGQEFLIRTPSTVPEPSTYLLMGTGLLLLGVVGWRRRSISPVEEA